MGLANAQLCAAIRVNDYYEQLVINEEQINGLKNLGKLAIVDGVLNVSSEPGLGHEIDWAHIERVAVASA